MAFPLFVEGRKEGVKEEGVALLLSAYHDSKKRRARGREGGREGGRRLTIVTLSLSSTVMEVLRAFRNRLKGEEEEEGREEGGGEVRVVSGEGGREGGREIKSLSEAEESHSNSSFNEAYALSPSSLPPPPRVRSSASPGHSLKALAR